MKKVSKHQKLKKERCDGICFRIPKSISDDLLEYVNDAYMSNTLTEKIMIGLKLVKSLDLGNSILNFIDNKKIMSQNQINSENVTKVNLPTTEIIHKESSITNDKQVLEYFNNVNTNFSNNTGEDEIFSSTNPAKREPEKFENPMMKLAGSLKKKSI